MFTILPYILLININFLITQAYNATYNPISPEHTTQETLNNMKLRRLIKKHAGKFDFFAKKSEYESTRRLNVPYFMPLKRTAGISTTILPYSMPFFFVRRNSQSTHRRSAYPTKMTFLQRTLKFQVNRNIYEDLDTSNRKDSDENEVNIENTTQKENSIKLKFRSDLEDKNSDIDIAESYTDIKGTTKTNNSSKESNVEATLRRNFHINKIPYKTEALNTNTNSKDVTQKVEHVEVKFRRKLPDDVLQDVLDDEFIQRDPEIPKPLDPDSMQNNQNEYEYVYKTRKLIYNVRNTTKFQRRPMKDMYTTKDFEKIPKFERRKSTHTKTKTTDYAIIDFDKYSIKTEGKTFQRRPTKDMYTTKNIEKIPKFETRKPTRTKTKTTDYAIIDFDKFSIKTEEETLLTSVVTNPVTDIFNNYRKFKPFLTFKPVRKFEMSKSTLKESGDNIIFSSTDASKYINNEPTRTRKHKPSRTKKIITTFVWQSVETPSLRGTLWGILTSPKPTTEYSFVESPIHILKTESFFKKPKEPSLIESPVDILKTETFARKPNKPSFLASPIDIQKPQSYFRKLKEPSLTESPIDILTTKSFVRKLKEPRLKLKYRNTKSKKRVKEPQILRQEVQRPIISDIISRLNYRKTTKLPRVMGKDWAKWEYRRGKTGAPDIYLDLYNDFYDQEFVTRYNIPVPHEFPEDEHSRSSLRQALGMDVEVPEPGGGRRHVDVEYSGMLQDYLMERLKKYRTWSMYVPFNPLKFSRNTVPFYGTTKILALFSLATFRKPNRPKLTESVILRNDYIVMTEPSKPALRYTRPLLRKGTKNETRCIECGLNAEKIPYEAECYEILNPHSLGKKNRKRGRVKCAEPNKPKNSKIDFRGCFYRYLDVGTVYTEKGCRDWPPKQGKSFASKRFADLERILQKDTSGCVISPHASITPFARGVSLFARYHACICTGKYCNSAVRKTVERFLIDLSVLSLYLIYY